jgi:uncharacterized protein YxjI
MNYPIHMSFKIVALAPQIYVRDASGATVCYVKQKLLKLKERIEIFSDETRQTQLCEIAADRIIDWSAAYHFTDPKGNNFGAVRRKGMRSLWKAHYEILKGEEIVFEVNEEHGWVKVADSILGEIPLIGAFAGYFLHPSYLVTRPSGDVVARIKKEPAFWEGKFKLEKLGDLDQMEEFPVVLSLLMMLLLERRRG